MGYHPRILLKDLIPAKQKKRHNVQPAPSSSRTPHSCYSHEAFEGSVPDLHSSSLLRVQRARAWSCLRTWSQRCLQPGLCQWWLCDPGQARPCVHWIPFLFSGPSRRPPPSSRCPPPCSPGQPPRCWPVHRQPPAPPALPRRCPATALPPHPVSRLALPWPRTQDCQQIRVNSRVEAIVICARNNLERAIN